MAYTHAITCSLYRGIKGYNPPDYYCNIGSKELAEYFISNPYYSADCKYVIDASLGKVTVNAGEQNTDETRTYPFLDICDTIVIADKTETTQYYVGKIVQRKLVAKETYEFIFSVDWYSSSALNFWMNSTIIDEQITSEYPVLYADNILYRRSSWGRFTYDDEGFVSRTHNIEYKTLKIYAANELSKLSKLFDGTSFYLLTCYACDAADSTTSIPFWFMSGPFEDKFPISMTPLNVINTYNYARTQAGESEINIGTFNPNNVLYFGCFITSMPVQCFPYSWCGVFIKNVTYGVSFQSYVLGKDNKLDYIYRANGNRDSYLYHDAVSPSDMHRYYIADIDGLPLLEYPKNVTTGTRELYHVYFNDDVNSPSLTFVCDSTVGVPSKRSFSIMARPLTYMRDNYAIYNAEQRIYNQEQRSLAATTNLVNGLTGAASEGAMMNAFSRSGGLSKGMIGGGVATIGAVVNYAYTELYANKEQTRIEDNYAKNQADTLMFSTDINQHIQLGGLIHEYYDDDTIKAIDNYHKKFGYKDDTVSEGYLWFATDNPEEFYIQADVMMSPGLRKEVDQYVQKMFSYGVRFYNPAINTSGE
jgi:hypothetical protein